MLHQVPEDCWLDGATPQNPSATQMAPPRDPVSTEDAVAPVRKSSPYDSGSSLQLYLSEIGKVKLLTPEQEVELAARIQDGDSQAREDMIKANLRLVVKIARDYENVGMPLMDLISEGNIGLMKAVGRFDPTKGAKLSTYASWWIKQAIKRPLANQSKTIRLPVHMVDKISKLHRTARQLHQIFGREPSDEELAEEMGITCSRVAEMRVAGNRPVSLDAPVGDDDASTFAEVVEDQNADNPLQNLESTAVARILRELVETLSPREAEILSARYGLAGSTPKTLDEVGATFGITRERVRQLQNRSLTKLRKLLLKLETPATEPALA